MLEDQRADEQESCGDSHEYWLAMQSAYAEYRRASEALAGAYPADDSSGGERSHTMLQGQQMVAFERYLEARMAFLEFWFHENKGAGAVETTPLDDTRYPRIRSWLAFANQRPVLQILAVLLMGTAAFCLVREQRHVRDLAAARVELQAARDQTRDELLSLEQRLDSLGRSQIAAIRAKPEAVKTQPAPKARFQRAGAPASGNFSLTPSGKYRRVGPIEVAVRTVDLQHKSVSLFILSDRVTMDVQRVKPNQPVWIKVGNQRQLLGLVIDRIARNRLDGHLIGSQAAKPKLGASRLKSGLPSPT
jgi:hypothetical protein